MTGDGARLALLGLAATAALVAGWWVFWFLCDDAYIAFRYVANRQAGWGYTWNAAPFRPVEGYTSFLWVVLLDAAWTVSARPPPETANVLSLGCALAATLGLQAVALRAPWSARATPWRTVLVALVLLGVLTNRTWLTFASSGLETALFGLLVLGWLWHATQPLEPPSTRLRLALVAGLLPLARPDGWLYLAATVPLLATRWRRADAWVAAPLALPLVHLVWRRAHYEAWMPNTFYAKHVAPWPEAGARYLASFVLEYSLWIGLIPLIVLAIRRRARLGLPDRRWLPWAVLALHLGYYTFLIGGDHFEYRVYYPLVPLFWLGLARLLDRLDLSGGAIAGVLAAAVLASWPIPWVHWWHTHTLDTRDATRKLRFEVAPRLPLVARPVAHLWDQQQDWLIERLVGVRQPTHKVFVAHLATLYPTREEGLALDAAALPVLAEWSVGLAGWTLPQVAIIDKLGLNDGFVARKGRRLTGKRRMAHDLRAPEDYVRCFRPNVAVREGRAQVSPRDPPLSAEDVVACEDRFWATL